MALINFRVGCLALKLESLPSITSVLVCSRLATWLALCLTHMSFQVIFAFLKAKAPRKISGFLFICPETGRDFSKSAGRNEGGSSDRDLQEGGMTLGLGDRAQDGPRTSLEGFRL